MIIDLEKNQPQHTYSSEEKLKWFGPGEWVEEPDFFEFEHCGIKCQILRIVQLESNGAFFGGHFCGYCEIPNSINDPKNLQLDVEPHGGITFNDKKEDESWWMGFDCAHSRDLVPSMHHMYNTHPDFQRIIKERDERLQAMEDKFKWMFESHYRNFDYVLEQTKLMAEQIVAKMKTTEAAK